MTAGEKKPELMLHDVMERITYGKQKLSEGQVIDLTGMERDVQALCESILKYSIQERENYAAGLEDLYNALSKFGDQLVEAREEVRAQLQSMSSHRKANVAYKTADSRDEFGGKKEGDGE